MATLIPKPIHETYTLMNYEYSHMNSYTSIHQVMPQSVDEIYNLINPKPFALIPEED